jgi:hypothetical protein
MGAILQRGRRSELMESVHIMVSILGTGLIVAGTALFMSKRG